MKKYIRIFTNSLQEYFVYRTNFILWRARNVISVLITYYLWTSVFQGRSNMFGYDKNQMLTYIILLVIINGCVLSTQLFRVGEEIRMGYLSRYLIRPLSYFLHNVSRDAADKLINLFFSITEMVLLYLILKPTIFFQSDGIVLFMFLFSLLFSAVIYFEINLVIALLGFWIHDTWPLRFLFITVIAFLAGSYFPLDILPGNIYGILIFLPFSYLLFFPLKLYLGHAGIQFAVTGLSISAFWIVFFLFLIRTMWKEGLKVYTSEGQ